MYFRRSSFGPIGFIRFTVDVLNETVRRVAAELGVTLDHNRLALVRQCAFPRSALVPVTTMGVAEYERIATVQPGERLFLLSSRLCPNAHDSFVLENPIGLSPEVVRLQPIGEVLRVNAPEGMQAQMDNAVTRVVRGLLL
jgi:hypothetical protein